MTRKQPPAPSDSLSGARSALRGTLYDLLKSLFDFVFSLCASAILFPLMVLIAAAIVLKDFGNPIYRQERVGRGGVPFHIYKFRTMRNGADCLEAALTPEQLRAYRREYKLDHDPRLIGFQGNGKACFGGRLRQWSLDELPQIFFNVLLFRNMSLVGPRPILASELREFYAPEERQRLLSIKPGVTGYWQAYARNDAAYANRRRQEMELYYVERRSLAFDAKILCKTLEAVWRKRGAK